MAITVSAVLQWKVNSYGFNHYGNRLSFTSQPHQQCEREKSLARMHHLLSLDDIR